MSPADLRLAADEGRIVPSPTPNPLNPLEIRGLSVSYGGRPAVFSVDMTVPPQTMTAIVGPNGAGKSTLLKAALGVIPRLAGSVSVFGQPIKRARGRVAYVPQRASVDWDFPTTAGDVVVMGMTRDLGLLRPVGRRRRAFAHSCLERVGMADFANRQIGRLSGGQQQRVFLARSLAQNADLYVLDEPFAGVDAATERAIVDVLQDLKANGKSVVCVHHDLSTLRQYFDRALFLNITKIAEGPMQTVLTAETLRAAYGGRLAAQHMAALGLTDAPYEEAHSA